MAVLVLFVSCNSNNEEHHSEATWTDEDKESFLENCLMNSASYPEVDAEKYCECVVEKMQDAYSPEELGRLSMGEVTEEMGEFGRACLKDQGLNIADLEIEPTDSITQ
ncbi:MAG: hypothetical protein WD077_01370 [Bacteroidia bacterium]